jgi:tetratricopeptide (TPR) repeat protein
MLERSEALAKQTFAQRPEHRAAILESLASAYRTLGDLKKALALLDEAAALTQGSNDTSLGAEIQCHRGWIVSRTDAPDVGRRIIDAALASPGIDLLTRSACTRYLAFIAQDMSDGASMLSHALEARALAQQSPSYSREVDASLVASIATAYELVGQIDKADAHYAAALTTLEDLGLDRSPNTLVIRSNRAIAITGTGNPRVALAQYDAILRVLKQDDPTGTPAPTFLANRAAVLEQLGRYEEALAQFQEALQVARDLNNDPWTAYSLVGLGEVSRKSGDIDAAKRYVQQLEQLGGGVASSGIAQTRLQRLRARLALSDGDHDRARNVARELIGDDTKRVSPESWLTAAEIELAAGDLDAAERYARSALEQSIARQSGMSHSNATGLSWLMLSHVKLRQNDADAARDALTNAVRHLENTVDGAHPALQDAAQLGERPADVKRKM